VLKLLERNIASVERRLVLVAPPDSGLTGAFRNVDVNPLLHAQLVGDVQTLRGNVYLEDGAITRTQLVDGRHVTPEDGRSWHLLALNKNRQISACAWYLQHDGFTTVQSLRVRSCPLASAVGVADRFKTAIELELRRARSENLKYAEVGGWAVSKDSRCTSEGLLLALAAYSLGKIAGGALGLTTATVRHASSAILRRLGGSHLEVGGSTVPPYYDPRYKCEMELLRFDSRRPDPKYAPLIDMMAARLRDVLVVASKVDFGRPGRFDTQPCAA
jgi:hypothetical protein